MERIQRAANMTVPELSDLLHEIRLKELGKATLQKGKRGDLIELCKKTSGMDVLDRNYLINMEGMRQLRGHSKKLSKGAS